MSAESNVRGYERIRLARMSLAEVGVTPQYFVRDDLALGRRVTVLPNDDGSHRKAIRIARLRVDGPSSETNCDAHPSGRDCAMVTVVDALLGRVCYRATRR